MIDWTLTFRFRADADFEPVGGFEQLSVMVKALWDVQAFPPGSLVDSATYEHKEAK